MVWLEGQGKRICKDGVCILCEGVGGMLELGHGQILEGRGFKGLDRHLGSFGKGQYPKSLIQFFGTAPCHSFPLAFGGMGADDRGATLGFIYINVGRGLVHPRISIQSFSPNSISFI